MNSEKLLGSIPSLGAKVKKAVVAMSGGVDSSTVAAVLKYHGYDVVGVTLQLYDYGLSVGKKGACCAGQDIYDASTAAQTIGIPHYVLNYESIFKKAVIDDFTESYLRGETPIPCVRCNQKVKFQDLFKVAKDLGADCLATGHYVQRVESESGSQLHQGVELSKDQSYFLFTTTQEQLEFLRFPLGAISKQQTRELANYFNLKVAQKPDSQDICFVPNGSYSAVIEKYRPGALEPGNILFKDGTPIGRHEGIIGFTIGQRKGIGIASDRPLYVIEIDIGTNSVIVGYKEDLLSSVVSIKEVNWLCDVSDVGDELSCTVKLRSSHNTIAASVVRLPGDRAEVRLEAPYSAITPGQACVMYDGTRVLGGGWIERHTK